MSQRTLLIASIALVVGLFSILIFARGTGPLDLISPIFPPPAAPPPAGPPPAPGEERSLEGRVTGVAASARVISLAADGREFELALTSESRILGEQGQSIPLGEVLRGLSLRADGRMTGETTMVPDSVRLLDSPEIIVYEPEEGGTLGFPAVITGIGRAFENTINYRILNSDATVLLESFTMVDAPDVGKYGRFEIRTNYPRPKTGNGFVEVLEYSARDGSEINKVRVPVRFQANPDTMSVRVYFGNRIEDPEVLDCSRVFVVERRIERTQSSARRALEELLEGPTTDEGRRGFITSINPGVRINSVTIQGGTARADFNELLELNVGGSCRVTAIRAQIEETLKQFASVDNVVISVNGRTEDILQP